MPDFAALVEQHVISYIQMFRSSRVVHSTSLATLLVKNAGHAHRPLAWSLGIIIPSGMGLFDCLHYSLKSVHACMS